MKLIVGLGNPGFEYENTRHNIGFMVLDNYLKENPAAWQKKFNGLYQTLTIQGKKVYFLKPQTYMNLSGSSIQEFVHYFKINLADILVIHDDLDLKIGRFRLKTNSSAGGHNGIKSIINSLGTENFARLKIGISKIDNIDTKDYVLGKFKPDELTILENLYPTINDLINDFLTNDLSTLMNKYNKKQVLLNEFFR